MQQYCQICGKIFEFSEKSWVNIGERAYVTCPDCGYNLEQIGIGKNSKSRPYEDGIKYFEGLGDRANLDENLRRHIFQTPEQRLGEEINNAMENVKSAIVLETTTDTASGYCIKEYLGTISTDPNNPMPPKLQLAQLAISLGANAIVGIQYSYIPVVHVYPAPQVTIFATQ